MTSEECVGLEFMARQNLLQSQWSALSERYLPVDAPDSIWRFSRKELPADPAQGWKLHVSATLLSAVRVLQAVAPLLSSRQVLFKAPASLDELDKLNSGVLYGYSQVGKFLTVYPQSTEEAVELARELDRLTRKLAAPAVPFDTRYRESSCVHYRYGAFKTMEIENPDGARTHALRVPGGRLIPDNRDSPATPDWLVDPFPRHRPEIRKQGRANKLETSFKTFCALAQRGRGGVYQALDLSVTPPRLCVIKQGRRHGEVSWDGRDGRWRVKHEKHVLTELGRAGIAVPRVYSSFKANGNYYLVVEFIDGEGMDHWLTRRRRRLPIAAALSRSADVARLVASVHAKGWVWRDCKPHNIVVTEAGELRPLDFEGACPIDQPDPLTWGTPGYTPPELNEPFRGQQRLPEDLYALGVMIYLLLAGRPPEEGVPVPLEKMRKDVPAPVHKLVGELLDRDPGRRPCALAVAQRIEESLKALNSAGSSVPLNL